MSRLRSDTANFISDALRASATTKSREPTMKSLSYPPGYSAATEAPLVSTPRQRLTVNPETTWFTADTHLGHANILRLCDRPFQSVEKMDAAIRLNLTVIPAGHTLIHLGDVAWRRSRSILIPDHRKIRRILVRGNHDLQIESVPGWDAVVDYLEVSLSSRAAPPVVLSHYPFEEWNGFHRGAVHLHGHTHNKLPPIITPKGGRVDAGVDAWDFRPLRLNNVYERLDSLRTKTAGVH